MEVFDPQQNTWTSLAATPVKVSHVQAVFDGSFIWLVGGYVGIPPNHQPLATTFKYDVANDKWLEGPVLPDTRAAGAAVIYANKLHYFGGLYNQHNDTGVHYSLDLSDAGAQWKQEADVMLSPKNHFQAAVVNGAAFMPGGQYYYESPEVVDSDDFQSFDFGTNQWSTLTKITAPTSHSATLAMDDRVVVIGGRWEENSEWALDTIREYDPVTDTWTNLAPLPRKLISPVAGYFKSITVDGQLGDYLVVTAGGYDWNQCQTNTWIARVTRDEACRVVEVPQSVPQTDPQTVPQAPPIASPVAVPQESPVTKSVPSIQSPVRENNLDSTASAHTFVLISLVAIVMTILC
eukprot:TRINITY_DN14418_c0_g1_i1.p1 TRINITY_DN14418_c0_g1~~TRINITY_DN14418_c0_g1_i1.p1  ORF type:complete len:408 (+),score=70.22 TRINITY_DN14418_c0_g1_i1:183-1226(+)